MLITIADVLSSSDLNGIRTMLGAMCFEDGRATAGWSAKLVKDSEQAREGAALDILRDRVTKAIQGNEVFNLAARPKALTPLLFSRYTEEKHYGSHVDNPLMHGIRTDVSFTLFWPILKPMTVASS
jgi:PKHD-type hydroxylase